MKEPSQSAQATGEVRDDAPTPVEVAAQEELHEDIPLVINEDRAGETDEEECMEAETRGKKRQSYNDEVTDSFQKEFPPQKSMRPSETRYYDLQSVLSSGREISQPNG